MTYQLNKAEEKEINKIQNAYYIQPTLTRINSFIQGSQDQKEACKLVFNELYNIISEAYNEVDLILDQRIKEGLIKDKKQANKSVVYSFTKTLKIIFICA